MRMQHPAKNGYSLNASTVGADTDTAYGYGKSNRYIAIRNASAHMTHVKFLGVTIINGVWPHV